MAVQLSFYRVVFRHENLLKMVIKMKIIAFFNLVTVCSASNILLMFPLSAKSHVNSFVPLFKKLSDNGHNLTMVQSAVPKVIIPNCKYIMVESIMDQLLSSILPQNSLANYQKLNEFTHWPILWELYPKLLEDILRKDPLNELVEGNYTFDLMISENLYLNEIFVAFGHIFNVPVINIDSHPPSAWSCYLTGNVNPYAYVPNFKLPLTDRMSFKDRALNTILNVQEVLGSYYYYIPTMDNLMRKYLSYGKYDFPPLIDMLRNTSLTLVDSHFSLGYVRPYLQNMVEVGGLTFRVGGQLDEEYQKYMDESTNGVIYFTFGSIMNITFLPEEMIEVITSTFAQLKQNVIMKWETGVLQNKPKNVKTGEWLPQNGILAHPNCRLFITHGGIHGLTEAIYHKVPLVIIPLYSDQHYNAKFAEKEGFANILSFSNFTSEKLLHAINTAMFNIEFRKNIERRSSIIKDKALSSLDTATFWVEYVLRHKGAKHLRPASLDLNVFQYFLLDVISAIAVCSIVCSYVIYTCLCTLIRIGKYVTYASKKKME